MLKVIKVIRMHPLWTMNVCIVFHDNPLGHFNLNQWTDQCTNQQTYIPIPRAMPLVWPKMRVLLDKTAPVTWDAVYTFSVFKTFYLTPVAPQHITLKGLFFSSSITSGNSARDKSKYQSSQRLQVVLAELYTLNSGTNFLNRLL